MASSTGVEISPETDSKTLNTSSPSFSEAFPQPKDLALLFKDLTCHSSSPSAPLLSHVSGYVRKGGITALLGASGSGKSLLLRLLAGRETLLKSSGHCYSVSSELFPFVGPSGIGFVGQEDSQLLGELTPREVLRFHATLGSQAGHRNSQEIEEDVQKILNGLSIQKVADNAIGTVIVRGLSGGEKRRVSVGAVLASRPFVMMIDEPTSGLDGSVAFTVIESIKKLAQDNGIGIMLTIHQPSSRILELFDDLIVLEEGRTIYSGPTRLSVDHFASSGFPCPSSYTPTDHFLAVTKTSSSQLFTAYEKSSINSTVTHLQTSGQGKNDHQVIFAAPLWKQVAMIMQRNLQIAMRDVTLQYLQMVLTAMFAFMVGAVFWSLPRFIGPRLQDESNGLVWLVFIAAFLQIFKVYHLYTNIERARDEKANQLYSSTAWTVSSFMNSAMFAFLVYVPTLMIGFGMMSYPNDSAGVVIFALFLTALTSESLLELICHFCTSLPTAILISQGFLVILCVFTGGAFIRWSSLGFWVWLSDFSLFTYASRAMIIKVFRDLIFACPSQYLTSASPPSCSFQGINYPCQGSALAADGSCSVNGSTTLALFQGVTQTDEFFQLGMLIVLMAGFRIINAILFDMPISEIFNKFSFLISSSSAGKSAATFSSNDSSVGGAVRVDVGGAPIALERGASLNRVSDLESFKLTFQNVNLNIGSKSGKLIIDNLCGEARSGRVLAVMGPSGSGKTTFLNAISGRASYATVSGTVDLGGRSLTLKDVSYVPQFDSLSPSYSVTQALCYTASLLQAESTSCDVIVRELIDILDLNAVRHTRIEKLNSGVRKRVSIGVGLLSRPLVLLCDEPTTGLDSNVAAMLVEYLIKVARRTGVVLIMTIHQPSAQMFDSLDDLLLLSSGKQAYFGPVSQAGNYFSSLGFNVPPNSNASDLYLDLMNAKPEELKARRLQQNNHVESNNSDENKEQVNKDDTVIDWRALFDRSSLAASSTGSIVKVDLSKHTAARPSELKRLFILTGARLVYFWQTPVIYLWRLIELILIAIFTGTLFLRIATNYSNIQELGGAIFFSIWTVLFIAISGTPSATRDRITFETEFLNQTYGAGTFLLASLMASIPYQLISAIIYEAITWFLVGFNDTFVNYVFATASTFSLFLMTEAIALIIVEVLRSAMLATTFSMVVLGFLFLMPGFFVSRANMPASISWLSYVVPTHYSLNSQLDNVFSDNKYAVGDGTFVNGLTILSTFYSYTPSYNKWIDFFIVLCYLMLFKMGHYMLLKFVYRNYGKIQKA